MIPKLLIMAAGIGSRYGGLKQIDPVGPHGELIIEYSLFDAVRAGFEEVVFIIRRDFEELFRERISRKLQGQIKVQHAFQSLESCLGEHAVPPGREKPWGTGHALLAAREYVDGPFAAINADDYYGPGAFRIIFDNLARAERENSSDIFIVGYTLRNTLSDHGYVSRGVCTVDDKLIVRKIDEHKKIHRAGNDAEYEDESGRRHPLRGDSYVSMNLWGFMPLFFDYLAAGFNDFLNTVGHELKSEYLIPTAVDRMCADGVSNVRILPCMETWFGVTYPEDKPQVIEMLKRLHDEGSYPVKLWA